MRFVFVHNHIYKNAGMTVDAAFERAGFRNTPLEATAAEPVVSPRRVTEAVLADPGIEYVSSHSLVAPRPPDRDDVIFVDISFVRHPLDRLYSMYRYSRQPGVGDFPMVGKAASLAQFVDALARDAPFHLHSPQTVCFGNERKFFHPPGAPMLARASAAVLDTRFLGVVELLDLSFASFVRANPGLLQGKDARALAGPHEPVNRSPSAGSSLEARVEKIAAELGGERFAWLERANAADLELHRVARDEVLRRHAAM